MSDSASNKLEKCPVHGNYYRVEQGCTRCQAGEPGSSAAGSQGTPSDRSFPFIPVFVLLLFGVGGYVWWSGRDPGPAVADEGGSPAAAATDAAVAGNPNGFDPNMFRSEIEAVEKLLYEQTNPQFSDPDRAQNALMALAEAVRRRGNSRLRTSRLFPTLIGLGSQISGLMDAGYQEPKLDRFQEPWEEIRNQHFQPAPWFHHRSEGADAPE